MLFAPAPSILNPADSARVTAERPNSTAPDVWCYTYQHPAHAWRVSIATCAPPHSRALSLGGFRIATIERTAQPGFDSDQEAINLAIGMDDKVAWSRRLNIAGPLARASQRHIVGGKCVVHPTPDARVGEPHDRELLDFALTCARDAESRGGFSIVTGQDLGHGTMSDGVTSSLRYLHERFPGSMIADTSQPTGEGNFVLLRAMLRGFGIAIEHASVGLIGCGNVGTRVLTRLRDAGAQVMVMDSSDTRRAQLNALGIPVFSPDERAVILNAEIDALVVNAAGGSLNAAAIALIVGNPRLRVICGSENLAMHNVEAGSDELRVAGKAYAPTELGGMMGYLTALEEYLARETGVSFDADTLIAAASQIDAPVFESARALRESHFVSTFSETLIAHCATTVSR